MKNSHLVIVVVLALAAGYFAYPYFNSTRNQTENELEQTSELNDTTLRKASLDENKTDEIDPIESEEIQENKSSHKNQGTEVILEETSPRLRNNVEVSNEAKKPIESSGAKSDPSITGAWTKDTRDFSYYKLQKTDNAVSIAPTDPRLVLIRGLYLGSFEGAYVELKIGEEESFISFSGGLADTDVERSFKAPNETFFANVNSDGNLLLIQNKRVRIVLNIKNWPRPVITLDDNSTFSLFKSETLQPVKKTIEP